MKALVSDHRISVFTIPTREPFESDGTLQWNSTTLVLVELMAEGMTGLGFTYGNPAIGAVAAHLAEEKWMGQNVFDVGALWGKSVAAVRNDGRNGLTAMAISALDMAAWDLKARLLKIPLSVLWGQQQESVEAYGSGGFTSLSLQKLEEQLRGWKELGLRKVKIKVGTHPEEDPRRVSLAREVMGPDAEIMIDANEAYDRATAFRLSEHFLRADVRWFEQPIDARDEIGLRELRRHLPMQMKLTTGEYIYDFSQTRALLERQAADVVQLDVTRCKGPTGFFKSAGLCEAFYRPVSSHCAPSLHVALGASLQNFVHVEYFSDHARIERMAFDGVPEVHGGRLRPSQEPGLGLIFKREAMQRYAV